MRTMLVGSPVFTEIYSIRELNEILNSRYKRSFLFCGLIIPIIFDKNNWMNLEKLLIQLLELIKCK